MQNYRTTSHSKYDLKVHLVWIPKYRKKVLYGETAKRARNLIRQICHANDIRIIEGKVASDHIHIFISYPPYFSISRIVQLLKGKTSHKLLSENKLLKKQFWGRHLWARGYFAVSSGNITDEMIKEYIREQEGENIQAESNFQITNN
ncbi:MAG: IS200/IS605 family transposase [Candidatus Moranbacteria bacterium]|nr:IS200/IS605 family transposase [Candidatus Moranbacteria bacterium]